MAKVTNVNDAIDALKNAGVWVYCADMDGEDVYSARLTGPAAFVIGGEGEGVKRLTKQKCDAVLKIPMFGQINSLNASVAAGVLMYEIARARAK